MHRRIRAEIDLDALRHNLGVARAAAGERAVWAVIKADAYGHGMVDVARALDAADGFCVADVEEGLTLRGAGITAPVLVLQGAFDGDGLVDAVAAGLSLVVHDPRQVEAVEAAADAVRASASRLWLKVDTGMHRLGVAPSDAEALHARLVACIGAQRVGRLTHFACADDPQDAHNELQLDRFAALAAIEGSTSLCNSAALLAGVRCRDDLVRPGIMLYGASPFGARTAAELGLVPVMTLRSRIIAERVIAAGEPVGYGASWRAERETRVGIVAAGYGDGYPRTAPAGTRVRIGASHAGLIGRVSMDSLTVDLTDLPDAGVGSPVVLWGEGAPIDDLAKAVGTIGYEVLTRVPPRVPRVLADRRARARQTPPAVLGSAAGAS